MRPWRFFAASVPLLYLLALPIVHNFSPWRFEALQPVSSPWWKVAFDQDPLLTLGISALVESLVFYLIAVKLMGAGAVASRNRSFLRVLESFLYLRAGPLAAFNVVSSALQYLVLWPVVASASFVPNDSLPDADLLAYALVLLVMILAPVALGWLVMLIYQVALAESLAGLSRMRAVGTSIVVMVLSFSLEVPLEFRQRFVLPISLSIEERAAVSDLCAIQEAFDHLTSHYGHEPEVADLPELASDYLATHRRILMLVDSGLYRKLERVSELKEEGLASYRFSRRKTDAYVVLDAIPRLDGGASKQSFVWIEPLVFAKNAQGGVADLGGKIVFAACADDM
jgi:hypothetical protein